MEKIECTARGAVGILSGPTAATLEEDMEADAGGGLWIIQSERERSLRCGERKDVPGNRNTMNKAVG